MQDQRAKRVQNQTNELPSIPDKLYFTIGEAAKLCDLKTHVLRYWEQEFPQLSPSKRRGNRRYYQRKDVLLIRQIKSLLYDQGFTIEGARTQLMGETVHSSASSVQYVDVMQRTIQDLTDLLTDLDHT